jgi:hypothetical protein
MREAIEEAFWNFVDQKWRDALTWLQLSRQHGAPEVEGELPLRMVRRKRP